MKILIILFYFFCISSVASAETSLQTLLATSPITGADIDASKDWKACRAFSEQGLLTGPWDQNNGSVPIWANDNPIPDICIPDTLYSWGSETLVSFFTKMAPENGNWGSVFPSPIFFHVNPVSTFAYGTLSIRVKLKSNVKYWINTGTQFNDHEKICEVMNAKNRAKDTVLIIPWTSFKASGTDYVICSAALIESWSFGTSEHLKEILKAYSWINTQPQSEWITYLTTAKRFTSDLEVLPVQFDPLGAGQPGMDSLDWSRSHLEKNITTMVTYVAGEKPVSAVNPENLELRKNMFSSRRKAYWSHDDFKN